MQNLTTQEIIDARLDDWRKLAQALHARYRIGDLNAGAEFVTAVAHAAQAADHRPRLTMTYGVVDISLATHQNGVWVTQKDVDMAREVSRIAREQALEPEPTAVAQLEVALDTANADAITPFWSVLLTGRPDSKIGSDIIDPSGQVPVVWFQTTDDHETPRMRWHLDVSLAPEVADERIAAAVDAGGSVVDDSAAPSFTVLADPDGNKACVCTFLNRG